jgi:hypothetical protein
MNENESEAQKPTKQPSVATNRTTALADQASAIDAASIGGAVFLSAKTYSAAHPKVKTFQE